MLGSIIWSCFEPMLKLYAILTVGFFLGKKNIIDVETSKNISYLNQHILLPCFVFDAIVTNLQYRDIKQVAIVCFGALLYALVGGIVMNLLTCVGKYGWVKNWRYGSLFAVLFSTGPNIMISFLQSLQNNKSLFNSDEINRAVALTFIMFAMEEFLVIFFDFQRLVKWDFGEEKKNVEHEKYTEKDPEKNSSPVDVDDQSLYSISSSVASNAPAANVQLFSPSSRITEISQETQRSGPGPELRAIELRKLRSQNINDVVKRFTNPQAADALDLARSKSVVSNGLKKAVSNGSKNSEKSSKSSENTSENSKSKIENARNHIKLPHNVLKCLTSPYIVTVLASFAIAMVPWLKALFVPLTDSAKQRGTFQPKYHQAPDSAPALNLFINYASYIGGSQVPISLFLLGATLSHLDFVNYNNTDNSSASSESALSDSDPSPLPLAKTYLSFLSIFSTSKLLVLKLVLLAVLKLAIMPIIGIPIISAISTWIPSDYDKSVVFVMASFWGLPSYMSQVYITAVYTDSGAKKFTQLHILSCFLYLEYFVFFVSFPFVTVYVLKHVLRF